MISRGYGELSDAEIAHLRLRVQAVADPRFSNAEAVVGWLGAVQAQEYAYAKWSLGARAVGVDEAVVDRALASGTILRTHVLRPTWHYVRREDIRWLLTATAPRVRSMMASYDRALELDEALYARSNDLIARAVEGGSHRTRGELAEALADGGIAAKGQRLGHIVLRAELDAIVCSGAPRGKQTTYALLSERAPEALDLAPDEALAELTRRYFRGHGPATEKDFRWWASLTAAGARRGLEMLSGELERGEASGRTYHWLAGGPEHAVTAPAAAAHLLQAYDECFVGYTESRGVIDTAGLAGALVGGNAFHHVVIVDGQAAGRWRRQIRRGSMTIELQPLRRLSRSERTRLDEAISRYADFSGIPAEVAAE